VDATARSDKKVRMGFCDGTAEALSRIIANETMVRVKI
jgi:hypothetical protein